MHPPFAYTEAPDAGHGRLDERTVEVHPFEPAEADLPYARSLVVVRRQSSAHQSGEPTVAFYLSSLPPVPRCAQRFAGLIRGHWSGCEIRNHWIRDALFAEDKTRSKNPRLNANLAILRTSLIALVAFLDLQTPWPVLIERCQHNPAIAYQMIVNHLFK